MLLIPVMNELLSAGLANAIQREQKSAGLALLYDICHFLLVPSMQIKTRQTCLPFAGGETQRRSLRSLLLAL